MTKKHSPLPWNSKDDHVNMENGLLIAECYGCNIRESTANAALIVRSVNALPDLVAALEDARLFIAADGYRNSDGLLAEIDRVLSKVKG